jgi:hypothetical protein
MPKVKKCKECDWRVESLEVVRTEEWDADVDTGRGLVTCFAPVYKIKAVCKCCGDTTYREKTCYNQAEIPKKGESIRMDDGV